MKITQKAFNTTIATVAPNARIRFFDTHINVMCTSDAERTNVIRAATGVFDLTVDRQWYVNQAWYVTFKRPITATA